MFTTLKAFRDPPPKVARRPRSWWLSDATTRVIDQKAHMVRNPLATRAQIKKKGREIKQSLKKDVIRRCTVAAEAIAAYLTGPPKDWNLKGAYGVLGRWHKHAAKHPPKPSREDLITVTNDRIQLYQQELPSPPGEPIPVLVQPDPINDSVPTLRRLVLLSEAFDLALHPEPLASDRTISNSGTTLPILSMERSPRLPPGTP